ncbi:MAG TPA: hypothetical protein VLF09_03040 [Cellvibrio sp.]|nr:hypothetical protein [Cellvibrio sp.]
MTTTVSIKAHMHDQNKVVHVKVNDQLHTILKPGEETVQHVYSGNTITLIEADAEQDTTASAAPATLAEENHNHYEPAQSNDSDSSTAAAAE